MNNLSDLTPAERARQLGKPEGELGVLSSDSMYATNARGIEAA